MLFTIHALFMTTIFASVTVQLRISHVPRPHPLLIRKTSWIPILPLIRLSIQKDLPPSDNSRKPSIPQRSTLNYGLHEHLPRTCLFSCWATAEGFEGLIYTWLALVQHPNLVLAVPIITLI